MSRPRELVEMRVNPSDEEFTHRDVFGVNQRTWKDGLIMLGLVVRTDFYAAQTEQGVRVPYVDGWPSVRAEFYDKRLLELNQYAFLDLASRGAPQGLGIHMTRGTREFLDKNHPKVKPGIAPRVLEIEEVLQDIARVTMGGVQRHSKIPPHYLEPTVEFCREVGTIQRLEWGF